MSCECNNPENIIFGKTSVNVRCMDKGVYTGKYFGLHTTEESCCNTEDPISIAANKISANCILSPVYVGKASDLENISSAIPDAGQIIVYTDDNYVFSGFKVGNGTATLADLPFATFK